MLVPRRCQLALLAVLALGLAGCSGDAPKTEPPTTDGGATPTTTPATPTQAAPQTMRRPDNAPDPVPGLKPGQAKGVTEVEVRLSKPVTLGGIQLDLGYDPLQFVAGQPTPSDSLKGYMSAANPNVPGILRWSCAGMGQSEVQVLATVPIHYRDAPPKKGDLSIQRADLVDPSAQEITGIEVELRFP